MLINILKKLGNLKFKNSMFNYLIWREYKNWIKIEFWFKWLDEVFNFEIWIDFVISQFNWKRVNSLQKTQPLKQSLERTNKIRAIKRWTELKNYK